MQAEPLLSEAQLRELENSIKILAESPTVKLDDISNYPKLYNSYIAVKSIASILYENGEYSKLLPILKSNKPKKLVLKPGTIGAFLFGCLNSSTVPNECTPDCIGSLPNSNNNQACSYQVWVLNEQLQQLTPSTSTSALVYADTLTPAQLTQLANAGVTSYSLVTNKNGKYQQGPVHTLSSSSTNSPDPVNMGNNTSAPVAVPANSAPANSAPVAVPTGEILVTPQPNNTGLIIAIIIIIIIIIVIVWLWNRNKNNAAIM